MKPFVGKLILIGIGCIVAFAFLEVGVRILNASRNSMIVTVHDPKIALRYLPNLDEWRVAEAKDPIHFKTNEVGFAGPSFETAPTPGVARIVSLGDSFTAGAEVDFDKRYSALLGDLLRDKGIANESLNFGVAGQGTGHALATYRTYVSALKPDVVVLWFFMGNDFEDNLVYAEGWEDGQDTDEFILKRIARKSELALLVVNKMAHVPSIARLMNGTILHRVGGDTGGEPGGIPLTVRLLYTDDKENDAAILRTREYLAALKDAVAHDGATLVVAAIPVSYQVSPESESQLRSQYPELSERGYDPDRPRLALNAIVNELDIPYIDLSEAFVPQCKEAVPGENRCVLYNCAFCHLSKEGHEVAAAEVAGLILRDSAILQGDEPH